MKKFYGLLFCTDVDGTLFDNNRTVSKENLDAIEYFKKEGGLFTFITGRVPQTAGPVCKAINPNVPYGCINGGGVYDFNAQKYLYSCVLPKEATLLLREVDKKLPCVGIHVNTEKDLYINKDCSALEVFRDFFDQVLGRPISRCHYEDVKEPMLKVVLAHDDEDTILELEKLLTSHPKAELFDFIRSEKTLFEILPKGVSKGAGLLKMCELFGIDKSKTIAAGDYYNDISMIKAAGLGFAVENGVPELRAVADFVTVSNEQSAIAAIIDGLDRGIYNIN